MFFKHFKLIESSPNSIQSNDSEVLFLVTILYYITSRDWRNFTKQKYIQTQGKLSDSLKVILNEVKYFKSGDEIDNVPFSILGVIYATVVSKYKIVGSERSFTDPKVLSKGYGTQTIGDIVVTPKTMAYIMLLAAAGPKPYYDLNDLVLYSVYVSLVPSYLKGHGDHTFFCGSTNRAFNKAPNK